MSTTDMTYQKLKRRKIKVTDSEPFVHVFGNRERERLIKMEPYLLCRRYFVENKAGYGNWQREKWAHKSKGILLCPSLCVLTLFCQFLCPNIINPSPFLRSEAKPRIYIYISIYNIIDLGFGGLEIRRDNKYEYKRSSAKLRKRNLKIKTERKEKKISRLSLSKCSFSSLFLCSRSRLFLFSAK